ncbi:DUF6414 family protein [Halobellus inordinatus]|uniref:DUF6414 family protein n=1 Tax=Halobellus inordinatus TaxID=1126236 RepID=UPI00210EC9BE|nr:hypothetical protein [Halobellus inordinatus]
MIGGITRAVEAVYWWGVRRKNNAAERLGWASYPELKEFVYLDQTALISLLSSTTGGITQQQTTSKKQRISSSIKGSLGPIGASVGSNESETNETVQRYVVQSNFKELYEIRKNDLDISDHRDTRPSTDVAAPVATDIESTELSGTPQTQELLRGSLVELDATLKSSEIYEYFLIFDAFEDIVESFSSEEEFRQKLQQQGVSADEIAMVLELMEILMAGLIPIECEVSNYGVYKEEMESEDSEKVNRIIVANDWAEEHNVDTDKLYLAGFIDEDNLWQEPSRVLFSENEFTIYGRLDNPEPNSDWSPLKLVDILSTVFPETASDIEDLPSEFQESNEESTSGSEDFEDSVCDYLNWLESEADRSFPPETVSTVLDEIDSSLKNESHEAKEALLQRVEVSLASELSESDLEAYGLENIPRKRADFLDSSSFEGDYPSGSSDGKSNKIYLETNFVAVYW